MKRLLSRTLHDVKIQKVEKTSTHVNLLDIRWDRRRPGVSDNFLSLVSTHPSPTILANSHLHRGFKPSPIDSRLHCRRFWVRHHKSETPDVENPRHIVFVDIGHSSIPVAVVAYSEGQPLHTIRIWVVATSTMLSSGTFRRSSRPNITSTCFRIPRRRSGCMPLPRN